MLVKREVKVYSNRQQLYRTKGRHWKKIQGNVIVQHHQLRDYCMKTVEMNRRSTAILKLLGPPLYRNPTFQRLFVLYNAQNRGFIEGCRPIIGLDVCFLKGPFRGQLMAAVARDGNTQMYPLVFAVVESECKDSWSWFLFILTNAIGSVDEMGWSFISDRQKGLVEAFEQLMPMAEHRLCVRHLYVNFKLRFKDKSLKQLMWATATSFSENGFLQNLEEIKRVDLNAYNYLTKISPELWCKFKMSPRAKCDMLSNKLCESYNNYIKEAREQPILTILETLRRQLICKYDKKRRGVWEISGGLTTFVVNLNRNTCTCREWDITGIPCTHVVCAIFTDDKSPEAFVHPYYYVQRYKSAYSHIVYSHVSSIVNSSQSNEIIMPPPFKILPGRPKKSRKKEHDEIANGTRVTRKGRNMSCTRCGDTSHRTCKRPPMENSTLDRQATDAAAKFSGIPSTQTSTQASKVGFTFNTITSNMTRREKG
ncbi:hypothetical protein DH2020_004178 [Rehmannia glutinosa]|uniref:SWIM-type domain-containing protein n=1 Tax=Rehmannia glutinosa TaxID=99300 RepID=A0ABR0XNT5_REHGL